MRRGTAGGTGTGGAKTIFVKAGGTGTGEAQGQVGQKNFRENGP
jgi:hypothetical protein